MIKEIRQKRFKLSTHNPINGKGVNLSYVIDPTGGNYDQGLAQTYLTAAKESYNRDLGLPINNKRVFHSQM